MDMSMRPTDPNLLQQFGQSELMLVIDQFRLLLPKKISIDALVSEFKIFWFSNLTALPKSELWSMLLTRLDSKYPNLVYLFELLLKVEHGFSTTRRIKSDWRNRLGEDTLDHLMRISIEGPQLCAFDPQEAVQKFFSTPRRPEVQPYERKRGHEDTDN